MLYDVSCLQKIISYSQPLACYLVIADVRLCINHVKQLNVDGALKQTVSMCCRQLSPK